MTVIKICVNVWHAVSERERDLTERHYAACGGVSTE